MRYIPFEEVKPSHFRCLLSHQCLYVPSLPTLLPSSPSLSSFRYSSFRASGEVCLGCGLCPRSIATPFDRPTQQIASSFNLRIHSPYSFSNCRNPFWFFPRHVFVGCYSHTLKVFFPGAGRSRLHSLVFSPLLLPDLLIALSIWCWRWLC